jgi:ATP-binding cassette subfamily B protein
LCTSEVPALTFRHVSYRYSNSDNAGVTDLEAAFPPCSLTIVTGHSGCGKSTWALLAAGLVTPDSGTISVGGTPVDSPLLREVVTLIPQDPILFNASIRENLLFALPDASDEHLAQAVEAASLTHLVDRLPQGLDTPVGERGFQLSGGERQRLAFARALLADHQILIVDEATSALDGLTADEIYEWLHRWSRQHRTGLAPGTRLPRRPVPATADHPDRRSDGPAPLAGRPGRSAPAA